MQRVLLFILLVAFVVSGYCADNVPFNGLVCSADGVGVKAQITVKGADKRTVSGKDGKFGLTNINADDVLQLRYKKVRLEVGVEGRQSLKIVIGICITN